MTINPDILLGAAGAIFVFIAIAVARLAYRYGCARRVDADNRQLADHNGPIASSPAAQPTDRVEPLAVSPDQGAETEAVIINPQQGRITVRVIAQPDYK